MGPSGEGKSALLKTLGGVWKPSSGELFFDGRRVWGRRSQIQDPQILNRIGFAFQNNALFNSLRVLENLLFPHRSRFPDTAESTRRKLGESWLEKVGLLAASHQYPHELSGGMQKRLAIARTLMLDPDFIFLDDPTAGLDPITSKNIADLIRTLLGDRDTLVVIVTNDPDRAADWGSNRHFLKNGQLLPHLEGFE
jgi:phospholipid/cholesterol/gamma-HCH transport system ATP-binding protein